MKHHGRFVLAWALVLQINPIISAQSLGDVARESRAKKPSVGSALVISSVSQDEQKGAGYKGQIQALLARNAFVELDAEADTARTSKERVEGGAWKQFVFYETVSNPVGGSSSGDWTQHITRLQNWVASRPKSLTARIA